MCQSGAQFVELFFRPYVFGDFPCKVRRVRSLATLFRTTFSAESYFRSRE
jgi:hypothetical protein